MELSSSGMFVPAQFSWVNLIVVVVVIAVVVLLDRNYDLVSPSASFSFSSFC
jgi:hypothetical protein